MLAVGGDLGKEAEGGVEEVTGLGVLGLRLEDLHFAPEGRVVSNGAILLRGLELLLLAGTGLKVERAECNEGGVVSHELACVAAHFFVAFVAGAGKSELLSRAQGHELRVAPNHPLWPSFFFL